MRSILLTLVSLFLFTFSAHAKELHISSTIGPIDAGIVPLLAEKYEEKTGVKVIYEGAGTGATLEKAKSGKFDLVIVHARKLEDAFIKEGYGINRKDVMYNDFLILGPKNDPAQIASVKSAPEAFAKIAMAQAPFVTRGDKSGTHVKEMEVWEKADTVPQGDWYILCPNGKNGNRATLLFTNNNAAYTIMDRATWLIVKKDMNLVPLVEADPILLNYIAIIEVNPEKFSTVKSEEAKRFSDWITGSEAQEIINSFGVATYGERLFFPNAAAN